MITRKQLIQNADTIFAHTDAFNFPALFANRTDSREFIMSRVKGGGARLIVISDILGSGKTFLFNMVMNQAGTASEKALIAGRLPPGALTPGRLAAIDEWDIKANPKRFMKTLDQVVNHLATTDAPVILLGDYTLKSANFVRAVGGAAAIDQVPMEPLNPAFFDLALRQRLYRVSALPRPDDDGQAPDIDILDPRLSAALVPDWPLTSANFREVFRALMQLAEQLDPTDEPGILGGAEVDRWLKQHKPQGMSAEQAAFYDAYARSLQETVARDGWKAVLPQTTANLKALAGLDGLSDEAFVVEIVEPIARTPGLMAAMGYPEVSADGAFYLRFPEPFLPGIYSRLRAAFGG